MIPVGSHTRDPFLVRRAPLSPKKNSIAREAEQKRLEALSEEQGERLLKSLPQD